MTHHIAQTRDPMLHGLLNAEGGVMGGEGYSEWGQA